MMLVTDLRVNCQNWQVLEPFVFEIQSKANRVFDSQIEKPIS
jgi:hypothetical protein